MSAEEEAYKVLAHHYGFSSVYIKSVLDAHFETPSHAGEHMKQDRAISPKSSEGTGRYTVEEVRDMLIKLDRMRAQGAIPPIRRTVEMDWVKKDRRGKYYLATEDQLQEELRIQSRSSIDPDGNLVTDGEIVAHHWLQSFSK